LEGDTVLVVRVRGVVGLGIVTVLAGLLGPPGTPSGGAATPPFTSWQETFVDPSRPTPASANAPEAPSRTLVTTIYRPAGKGPFPLIVFSHGYDGHPDKFTQLLGSWAAAGYVVAAPAFPLTNSSVAREGQTAGDVGNQPGDVRFVLSQVLQEARRKGTRLFRAIDRRHIGAAGLSLGGATTYLAVFDDCCRDPRFTAAMVLDGLRLGNALKLDGHVPLLIAHSDTDPAIPYATARAAYDSAAAPVWLVTLHGASHASQWENDVTPYDAIGERLTLDFWNATLRGREAAYAALDRDATVADLSSIESRR
jgi:dienelactone hydrolase